MKNAIIFHAAGSNPNSFWLPGINKFVVAKGYSVWVPLLPQADKPELKNWLPFVLNTGQFDEETVLIGHSAGCPLILSILENIRVKIAKAILVSGFARISGDVKYESILQAEYDWKKIKENVKDIVFINSDNDPWGCNHKEGLYLWEKLGGTLILREGEGHMGSTKFKQPYTRFPLLEKLLEIKYTRNVIDGSDQK